tara:strand:- start:157 stop:669 length:513 start_codon:yes stop_codon:yes gene_type:complete
MSENALLTRIRSIADDFVWITHDLTPDLIHFQLEGDDIGDEGWSIHQHFSHVVDIEREVSLPLLRWLVLPEMLEPAPYSRKEWLETRYDHQISLPHLIIDLNRIREEELEILETISKEAWHDLRTESSWGPVTCQWVAELIYRHSLDHLQCIVAILQERHLDIAIKKGFN